MEIKIIPVNLGFVKAFLVKGDRTIIVDAGMRGSLKKIQAAMSANGVKPADVSLLLVTHVHMDHTGGLAALKEFTGAPIAVHALEAGCLSEGKSAPVAVRSGFMRILSVFTKRIKLAGIQPDIIVQDRLDLKPYGVDGYAFPTPGHTPGSLTVVTAGGEAVTGDMVGGGSEYPAIPGIYSDLAALKSSIASLAGHPIMRVYTSHAGVYAIADVLKIGR
jgi:glyoxylase-like metal-dependent hydrolase (beta-lactamase superfamily II)